MKITWIGSLIRPLLKTVLTISVVLVFLEISLRLFAFVWYGQNQYYLYHGLQKILGSGYTTSVSFGGYFKFIPNYVVRGLNGLGSGTASINSLGFRGPQFQPLKPNAVFRVICLGESSTFGFQDADTETYPFLLQKLFERSHTNLSVEVINAGFPYYNTANILSLLKGEILGYTPDLLTFYAGANDSGWLPVELGPFGKVATWLHQHSMIFYLPGQSRMFRRILKLIPARIDEAEFSRDLAYIVRRYRANVKSIIAIAKQNSIPLILIKQPLTSDNKKYVSVSYEEEYRGVLSQFRKHQKLLAVEAMLLRHHALMHELETLAKEENVPLVDNIAIVDRDRRRLVSWVHLTGEANLQLAEALKEAIEPYVLTKDPARVGSISPVIHSNSSP